MSTKDPQAELELDELFEDLHPLLRRIAASIRNAADSETLNATALVHEAYVTLKQSQKPVALESRQHFLNTVRRVMRRELMDRARHHRAAKRGGGATLLRLSKSHELDLVTSDELIKIEDVLKDFAREHPDRAEIATYRIFGGLENREIADFLEISLSTVNRRWRFAKSYLFARLGS